jgi:energy-coupling factor transporter ATP-binding protein EcfA2
MNRHVQELRLLNYRGFRDARLPLEGLTFLVGRNGAGKTTLVDALAFVREALTQSLPTTLSKRDGIGEVRSRFAAPGELLTVALVFGIVSQERGQSRVVSVPEGRDGSTEGTEGRCLYGFSLAADGTVAREVCRSTIPGIPGFERGPSGVRVHATYPIPARDRPGTVAPAAPRGRRRARPGRALVAYGRSRNLSGHRRVVAAA